MRIIRTTYTSIKGRSLIFSGSTSSNIGPLTCSILSRRVSERRNHTSGRVSSRVGILEELATHGSKGFSWIESFKTERIRMTIHSLSRMSMIIPHGPKLIRIISECSNDSIRSLVVPISSETGMFSSDNISENGNLLSIFASLSRFRMSGRKSYVSIMDSRIRRPSYGSRRIRPLTSSMYTDRSDRLDGYITRSSIRSYKTQLQASGIVSVRSMPIPLSLRSLRRRVSHFLRLQKCEVCV